MRKPNPDSPLAQVIVAAGLSQDEVAQRTGINPARISQFCTGALVPNPEQLQALAILLEVPAYRLLHPEAVLR